jgi:[acyl-carrier-protein] S-malonyltransferase
MARIVALFPGQGSQRVGMGRDFAGRYPDLIERYFAPADAILGFGLTELCFNGPDEQLVRTENTQPALFVVSLAVLDVLRAHGVEPAAAAGHSLGEYAALVCAGVLDFADGLRLVRRRGELMAAVNTRTPGAMAAIVGLAPEAVEAVCRAARAEGRGVVEPANFNTPEQTVISGERAAVARASALAKEAGAGRAIPLQVGAPFHCSLMEALADEFAAELDKYPFRAPRLPVVANVTGDYARDAGAVKDALRRQVAGSVRWADSMRRLAADGYDTFVEVGPGRALTGMGRKINPGLAAYNVEDGKGLDALLAALRGAA